MLEAHAVTPVLITHILLSALHLKHAKLLDKLGAEPAVLHPSARPNLLKFSSRTLEPQKNVE
jgi:hypothetical protein